MLTELIEQVIAGNALDQTQIEQAVTLLIQADNPCQCAALLAVLRQKGETVAELTGFIRALRDQQQPLVTDEAVIDIVGTGGDGLCTLNISTASALLLASCGAPVVKHGNRSVSSHCGSADVLAQLGLAIEAPIEHVQRCFEQLQFAFCFAPRFHPAMRALKSIRSQLGIRTCFNLFGPLLNPAQAQHILLGVYHPDKMMTVAQVLQQLGTKHSLVFHGAPLDELSTLGATTALRVTADQIEPIGIDPQALGFRPAQLSDLQPTSPTIEANANALQRCLAGAPSSFADSCVLNAGVGLWLTGLAPSIDVGIAHAGRQQRSGAAAELLANLIDLNPAAAN